MVSIRFACLVIICLAVLGPAQRDAFQKQFQERQAATATFQSGFKQTLRLEGVREPIVSSGKFFYAAPDSLLIAFEKPKGEYMLVQGVHARFKKSGKPAQRRKLSRDDWENGPSMLLELFRNGGRRFSEKYDVEMKDLGKDLKVVLIKKDDEESEGLPSRIENRLSRGDLNIKSVLVEFDREQSLLYEFLRPVRDSALDPSVFEDPERP